MSTVFAIIVSIIVGVLLPLGFTLIIPLLVELFEQSDTGGPILFGLLLAGVAGYVAYAAVYTALRMFKQASTGGVYWVFVVLAVLGQAANSWRVYQEGEGLLAVVGFGVVGVLATAWGAGLAVGVAVEDTGRTREAGGQ